MSETCNCQCYGEPDIPEAPCKHQCGTSSIPSSDSVAACDIIRRLVDKVNKNNEYDEHKCPNNKPCAVCKLVTEATAFIRANAGGEGRAVARTSPPPCSTGDFR